MDKVDELIDEFEELVYIKAKDSVLISQDRLDTSRAAVRAKFDRMQESLEKILDITSSSDPYRINLIIHNAMVGLGLKDDSKE